MQEIALIYNCKRTASVLATNYCTMAKYTQKCLNELFIKFPDLVEERFKMKIYEYDDQLTRFLLECVDSIDFFQRLDNDTKRDIIYTLKQENFERGALIFKTDEVAKVMFVLQNGIVEILTQMDKGVDFVIERLFRGAVINHRSFLLNDQIDVSARCVTPVSLFYLDVDDLQHVREKDPMLNQEIQRIEDEMINKENAIALDYIISSDGRELKRPLEVETRSNHLTVMLKNAVMYHIVKNREKRKVPKLSDILLMAVEKKKKEKAAARKRKDDFHNFGPANTYLTPEQFDFIKEQVEKIFKTMGEQELVLEGLKTRLGYLLREKDGKRGDCSC